MPGCLGLRESKPIIDLIQHQKETCPEVTPHFVMVDGHGIWHPKKFGLACYVGVAVDIPTFGVAKNFFSFDGMDFLGRKCTEVTGKFVSPVGDSTEIKHPDDNSTIGLVLKSCAAAKNPVFVSVGHNISLLKARHLTVRTAIHRVPEPTRQADLIGRDYVREHYKSKSSSISE